MANAADVEKCREEKSAAWVLAIRVAGIIIPIILALFVTLWSMNTSRIDAVESRISRVEDRQAQQFDRIHLELQTMRDDLKTILLKLGK